MKSRNSVLAISLAMLSLTLCGSRGETAIIDIILKYNIYAAIQPLIV